MAMMYGVLTYLSRQDGKILMIKKPKKGKDPNSGLCTLPGGKLESFEKGVSLEGRLEAAVRETKSETGISIFKPRLLGSVLFDNEGRAFDNWPNAPDYLVYIVASESHTGDLKEGDGGEIPFWAGRYTIPKLSQSVGDSLLYRWIDYGRAKKPFFGVIKYNGKEIDKDNSFVDYF